MTLPKTLPKWEKSLILCLDDSFILLVKEFLIYYTSTYYCTPYQTPMQINAIIIVVFGSQVTPKIYKGCSDIFIPSKISSSLDSTNISIPPGSPPATSSLDGTGGTGS